MKNVKLLTYFILGILLLNTSCEKPVKMKAKVLDLATVKSEIESNDMEYEKAYNSKDLKGLVSYYAKGAQVFAPNEKILNGLNAISDFYKTYTNQDSINYKIKLTVKDVFAAGDLAVGSGIYSININDSTTVDNGKYLSLFKKIDGKYKSIRDIWNSSKPLK